MLFKTLYSTLKYREVVAIGLCEFKTQIFVRF